MNPPPSPDTTYNSDSAETVTFSDHDEDLIKCAYCLERCPELEIDAENTSLKIINNIVWLQCALCHRYFHLSCVEDKIRLDDLLFIIEQSYSCPVCTGHH